MLSFIKNMRRKHLLRVEERQYQNGYEHADRILKRYHSEVELNITLANAYSNGSLNSYMRGYEDALKSYRSVKHPT